MIKIIILISTFMLSFTTFIKAEEEKKTEKTKILSPTELVQVALKDIINDMLTNQEVYKENSQKLQAMVKNSVGPYFNIERMAQLATAKYWKQASESQQVSITHEFQTLLIRTYTNTLFTYRNSNPQIISENKSRSSENKTRLKLKVKNEKGEIITLFLRLEKNSERWRIIDVNIEGVSTLITIRKQFTDEISKKGIEGFIQFLVEENRRLSET